MNIYIIIWIIILKFKNMPIIQTLKEKIKFFFLQMFLYIFIVFIIYITLNQLVYFEIIKEYFNEFHKNFSDFTNLLNFPILSLFKINLSLLSLLTFFLFLFVWFSIWKYYRKFIYWIKKRNKNLSHWTVTIVANIWYYIIIITVIISSLRIIWIDLSNLTMIISALSVGIWFGLRNIVSNFISGIILIFEQSIKTWDYIEIWTELRWTVKNINMRSTTVRTNNNIDIIVPNQSFIENNIINWTYWDNIVRLQIPFWVAYWTTFERVEEVILWALSKSDLNYIKTDDRIPGVVMDSMWQSSVEFLLNVWVQWDESLTPLSTRWLFLKMIYNALIENNITIPFHQTDLHIKNSIPLEIKLVK